MARTNEKRRPVLRLAALCLRIGSGREDEDRRAHLLEPDNGRPFLLGELDQRGMEWIAAGNLGREVSARGSLEMRKDAVGPRPFHRPKEQVGCGAHDLRRRLGLEKT